MPESAYEFASQLLSGHLVEELDILIVGAGNPEGIDYSRHNEALWRQNRRPNAGFPACAGVDLNRNFSIYLGQARSSRVPCDTQFYHGPSAIGWSRFQTFSQPLIAIRSARISFARSRATGRLSVQNWSVRLMMPFTLPLKPA
jgi:hypothetical protein